MVNTVCATHTYCTCIHYTVHNTEMCSNRDSTVLQRLNRAVSSLTLSAFGLSLGTLPFNPNLHCVCYTHTHKYHTFVIQYTTLRCALIVTAQSCRGRTRSVSSLTLSAFGLSLGTHPFNLPFTGANNTCSRFGEGVM